MGIKADAHMPVLCRNAPILVDERCIEPMVQIEHAFRGGLQQAGQDPQPGSSFAPT